MSDLSSLLKIEENVRSEAFKRGASYMNITTPIYSTLRPLTQVTLLSEFENLSDTCDHEQEDEQKLKALKVGNVAWVGMCIPKEVGVLK